MGEGQSFLLILADAPPQWKSLESLYGPPLTEALIQASRTDHSVLDIAVACPPTPSGRSKAYSIQQRLLAEIYRLGSQICTKQGIDPIKPGYVDWRVYLIQNEADESRDGQVQDSVGPVFSIQTLARSNRTWFTVYAAASPKAHPLVGTFVKLRKAQGVPHSSFQLITLATGSLDQSGSDEAGATEADQGSGGKAHKRSIVGGTFDNLHEGHKLLLSATALVLEPDQAGKPSHQRRLIVGITGDELLKNKKYAEMLESWDERQAAVFRFLAAITSMDVSSFQTVPEKRDDPGPNGKARLYDLKGGLTVELVEIQDPFGPTITVESITAIVISAETRSGGKAVNDRRVEKGWHPLDVFEVDLLGPLGSTDLEDKLSSTEKRRRRLEAKSTGT